MSDSDGGRSPIPLALIVLAMVGGGWYFFNHYKIDGLDGVSVSAKDVLSDDETFVSYQDAPSIGDFSLTDAGEKRRENPFSVTTTSNSRSKSGFAPAEIRTFSNLKIASWALDGFGPTKLANSNARKNVARVVRNFDIVAFQQVASIERDLIPRLVEFINQGGGRYDYVIGKSSGPEDRQEQLVFVFDTTRVVVDRSQTYTVDDPDNQMTFDPLVAWFRAARPTASQAWTFSLVNIRVDLARAPSEVALLPSIVKAIRNDGRGEDDVVVVGLFQADDAYLIPTVDGEQVTAAVQSRPTDIFGRYQTSNVLIDAATTSEYVGRGGVYEYLRLHNLSQAEAETVTSHLPVFGEFAVSEGGQLP